MRKISEQELKDILDKHGKWLKNEEGGERANLSSADLSYADLRSADLRYANLRYTDLRYVDLRFANLSYANLSSVNLRFANLHSANLHSANLSIVDLSYANLSSANLSSVNLSVVDVSYADLCSVNPMLFQFQRQHAFFTLDGTLRIGCYAMPISEWLLRYKEIGEKEGYTPTQIAAYGGFIKMCAEVFELECRKSSQDAEGLVPPASTHLFPNMGGVNEWEPETDNKLSQQLQQQLEACKAEIESYKFMDENKDLFKKLAKQELIDELKTENAELKLEIKRLQDKIHNERRILNEQSTALLNTKNTEIDGLKAEIEAFKAELESWYENEEK